jgi:hypothetical protein
MGAESRELMVGYRWGFGSSIGLGWDSNMMEGQGMVGDATLHDLDRDVARAGTWYNEDRDVKAWQGDNKDREAQNWR